jgi:septum formation inhibitor-activating ATPase MinD
VLGSIVLGPDHDLADLLYRRLTEFPDLSVYKIINEYPKLHHTMRLLNAYSPEVVFLEVSQDPAGWDTAADILMQRPETGIVGYTKDPGLQEVPAASGVSEILRGPFAIQTLQQAVSKALNRRAAENRDNIVAFIPAKAGSGSSTTALNIAGTLAQYWQQKILLLEADLHSGCLSVQLKLDPGFSILDALENIGSLDEKHWNRMVEHSQTFDLLLTTRAKKVAIVSPWEYQRLLAFVSPRYDMVLVDLPEVVNDGTEAVVTRAKTAYVVCTNELTSLFLARRRLHELVERGVEENRLGLILNRYTDAFESVDEIQDLVGRQIAVVLPNDYQRLREATLGEGLVDGASELGHAYADFARHLTGSDPAVALPDVSLEKKDASNVKEFFASNLRGLLRKRAS